MRSLCSRLAASSNSKPSQAQAWQMALRTGAAFSPTPAVKTRPSRPPSAAASEAMWRATRLQNRSTAKRARGLSLARSSRKSDEIPESPSMPERLYTRPLGIPTVADRIAQEVARRYLKPPLEAVFYTDSYGYRPGRSAIDAVRQARQRCWRYDWVLDIDVKAYFDSIDWERLLKAVRHHTDCRWVLLYIERWLKAPVQMEDGSVEPRTAGTPQGGVISPLLANLFLHYAFDAWMARNYPHIPFERYADDAICHCKSAEEARALWSALQDRFAACKLVLHPEKTKIVYCKDANRRGDFPNQSFDFLGFSFRARRTLWQGDIHTHGFLPAARPKALTSISRAIRRWALHHHSDKSLQDLAKMYNPYIEGWINYYGHFYRTHLRPTLKRIDAYVIRWARRKFKRLGQKTKGARDWFERLRRANPSLFAHWQLCHGNGRTSGAV